MLASEFAAARDGKLATFDSELRPIVAKALESKSYHDIVEAASVLWLESFEETSPGKTSTFMLKRFQNALLASLKKTSISDPPQEHEIDRVTKWVGTYTVNDAAYYGARSNGHAQKRWTTRNDADVRETHREAAGQIVGIGDTFKVGGYKLRYPGEPVGPPEIWIHCRCYVQPAGKGTTMSNVAFATDSEPIPDLPIDDTQTDENDEEFDDRTGIVIVALPAETDPIVAASSEDIAHMTMVWLGDAADLTVPIESIKSELASWAGKIEGPLVQAVSGTAVLGSDQAQVVLIDASSLAEIRNGMTQPHDMDDAGDAPQRIREGFDSVEQFPVWIPHVTLGYPDTPPVGEYAGTDITFDRLALWVGNDRTEYPMGATAMTASAAPLDEEIDDIDVEVPDDPAEGTADMPIPFHGVAAPIGVESGDKRMFAVGGVTFRTMPIPFSYQTQSGVAGHDNAVTPGYIDTMWIDEGNLIQYSGWLNPNHPYTDEVVDGIAFGNIRGVSVDTDMIHVTVDDVTFDTEEEAMDAMLNGVTTVFDEVRIAGLTGVSIPAFQEAYVSLGVHPDLMAGATVTDGTAVDPDPETDPIEEDALVASAASFMKTFAPGTHDGPGWITNPEDTSRIRRYWVRGKGAAKIRWGEPGDFNRCREQLGKYVRPNFLAGTCANMHKEALGVWPGQEDGPHALVASGTPAPTLTLVASASRWYDTDEVIPSSADFANPQLSGPTPVTVLEDGRVFGHVAQWGVCHIGVQGVCTTAPTSKSNYSYFRTGVVDTAEGDEIPVGTITLRAGHAAEPLDAISAMSHYDNTATAVADIACGEDAYGIWFAGRIRNGVPAATVRELKGAGISGDWRKIRGSYEMVGALAVNVQGFPIQRASLTASAGGGTLLAAGMVLPDAPKKGVELQDDFVRAVADEVEARAKRRERAMAARQSAAAALRSTRIQRAKGVK